MAIKGYPPEPCALRVVVGATTSVQASSQLPVEPRPTLYVLAIPLPLTIWSAHGSQLRELTELSRARLSVTTTFREGAPSYLQLHPSGRSRWARSYGDSLLWEHTRPPRRLGAGTSSRFPRLATSASRTVAQIAQQIDGVASAALQDQVLRCISPKSALHLHHISIGAPPNLHRICGRLPTRAFVATFQPERYCGPDRRAGRSVNGQACGLERAVHQACHHYAYRLRSILGLDLLTRRCVPATLHHCQRISSWTSGSTAALTTPIHVQRYLYATAVHCFSWPRSQPRGDCGGSPRPMVSPFCQGS
jgi:hypothetical protein